MVCLLGSSALAAEYRGQLIDGRKLSAKVYSYETGGVYEAQVHFDRDQAAIVFAGGGQLTLRLKQSQVSDPGQIEAQGGLGQIPLGRLFSLGLSSGESHPLQGLWSIRLDPANFSPDPVKP